MSFRFRPQLDTLEAREVPASFSFVLPTGFSGSGQFSTPDGVDPAQAVQVLPITGPIQLGSNSGFTYTIQGVATATYNYGVLVGGQGTATSPGLPPLTLNGTTVQIGLFTAPVAYNGADTEVTFTLPNGTVGAISYQIPWDQVDPTQASQSLTPTAFSINIAGQNIASGFTTAPTLTFEHGDLVGPSFALSLAGMGLPYTSVSMVNGVATAFDAANNTFNVLVQNKAAASLTIDFSSITIPQAPNEVKLRVTLANGTQKTATVEIQPGATKEQVRDLFKTALEGLGFGVTSSGTNGLNIKGTAESQLTKVEAFQFGNAATSPTVTGRSKGDGTSLPTYVASPN